MKCFSSEVPAIRRSFILRPLLASTLFTTAWWVPCFTANVFSLAPSTCNRWIPHTNPQLFEFAFQSRNFSIRYESGIEWTLNPDIFSSGGVTTWSPVLYREYRSQILTLTRREVNLALRILLWFWADSAIILDANFARFTTHALLPIFPKESWVVEWIRLRVGYVWTGKFDLNGDTCGRENFWIRRETFALSSHICSNRGPSPHNIAAFNSWIFISFSWSITKEYMLQTPAVWPFKSNL